MQSLELVKNENGLILDSELKDRNTNQMTEKNNNKYKHKC